MDLSRRRGIQSRSADRETTDGLLSGTIGPQDAPTEWRPVAELLTVLRTLPATTTGAGADAPGVDSGTDRDRRTVQAMTAVLAGAQAHKAWRRHWRVPFRPSVPRPLNVYRVRLATALVAASLAFMVGLASAGRLPGPAQNAISVALSKFGITIPRGGDDQSGKTTPVGPDLSGPEKKGLCNAYFSGKGNEENGKSDSNSVAFKNLQDAADKAGQSVDAFCADVLPQPTATSTGRGHGNGHGHGKGQDKANNDQSKSNGHGQGSNHSSNSKGH